MKKLTLLWILIFAFQLFAQNKNVALKFDEFSDYPAEKVSPLYDRTERFGERLKREPKTKNGVIVFYNSRKGKYPLADGKEWAERASSSIYQIQKDRIILIDGGYREYPTLEFWIVPKDAELPKPNPTFSKDEIVYCPDINVAGDGFRHDRKEPLKFSVVLQGAGTNEVFPLEWSVSSGKIIKGQNPNQIEVDLSGTDAKKITASVIVKGLPPECDAHNYRTAEIGIFPLKIDEFTHFYYSEIRYRLDSFMTELVGDPSAIGYLIVYASREGGKKDSTRFSKIIKDFINFRNFDPSRIVIIEGGFREEMMVELYLVPPGADPPKPTPTLNPQFVVEPKKVIKKRKKVSK